MPQGGTCRPDGRSPGGSAVGSRVPPDPPDRIGRVRRLARRLAPWTVGLILLLGLPSLFPELVRKAAPLLLYHPSPMAPERSDPAAWGLSRAEEVWLETDDGVRIHAWWTPASSRRRGTLLFLHGNAGNIGGRAELARDLADVGLDVLLVDYRGYGRSEGSPSEAGLYRDAAAAYRHLREERGVPSGELVVAGHSLGGAVAAWLASRRPAGAAVLTATFTDLSDAARAVYPWLPDAWFRWTPPPFPTVRRIADVDAPVLVGRGGSDGLIPRELVRAVYEASPEPRVWVEVPGAGHGDLWFHASFRRSLRSFVVDHVGR